jgi:hypothetical protein
MILLTFSTIDTSRDFLFVLHPGAAISLALEIFSQIDLSHISAYLS